MPAGAVDIWRIALWTILGLTLLRLIFLRYTPIELDFEEAQYWAWSRTLAWGYFSKPPLIAWLIRGATELCGDGAACVRAPSPLIHAASALILGAAGGLLGGRRLGGWAALVYATMPGVAFSAMLTTTDVPLGLFWAAALYCLLRLRQGGGAGSAIGLGIALGLGALSKYAMLFFPAGLLVYLLLSPEGRRALDWRLLLLAGVVGLLLLAPNLVWNFRSHWITVTSTAAMADEEHAWLQLDNLLPFVGGQVAIFGPVLLYLLLEQTLLWRRRPRAERPSLLDPDSLLLLLCLSMPFLLGFLLLSLSTRANGNWAAYAYVAGSLIVAGVVARHWAGRWLKGSVIVHGAVGVLMYVLILALPLMPGLPFKLDHAVNKRIGWQALGQAVAVEFAKDPDAILLTTDRSLTSYLLYYARVPVDHYAVWAPWPQPTSEYERRARLQPGDARKFLLVLPIEESGAELLRQFSTTEAPQTVTIPLWTGASRQFQLLRVQGFKGYGS